MTIAALPRLTIAALPTPLQPLPRLSAALGGPELWIKRDDLTGLAFGGNKTRKLELLLADAQAAGARTLLTTGAVQSNHCRQTAAAATRFGFECVLVLPGQPPSEAAAWTGNLLLDQLLGAELQWAGQTPREQALTEAFERCLADGRKPYWIPYGGSNALGAAAYAYAVAELSDQAPPFDRVVLATSSGGTQAGLVAGAHLVRYPARISGISVDQAAAAVRRWVAELAGETASLLGHRLHLVPDEVEVFDDYLGAGYGVMGEPEHQAICLFARSEGILLDPVYTGRAAAGLIDLIRRGIIGPKERVLFWHTGGTPALFAYNAALAPQGS